MKGNKLMMSIINAFGAYLLTEKRVAYNTHAAYMHDLKQLHMFMHKNNLALSTIQEEQVREFLLYLKDRCSVNTARSMARKISTLNMFFKWAKKAGHVQNVIVMVMPKIEQTLPSYLTEQDIKQLLDVADRDNTAQGKRNAVIIYLLYASGLRISELTNLKISQIDFQEGVLIVHGKGGKGRIVPIPYSVIEKINDYIATVHAQFVHTYGDTDYLFPVFYSNKIKPLSRQSCWLLLRSLCQLAGIQCIGPHQLRHSLATHLLKKGADLRSLQLLLGHENIATVQVYTHIETSHLRKIYDKKHPRS